MGLFEYYPEYDKYLLAHPTQSHVSIENDIIFKKSMAEAILKEKMNPKIGSHDHEDSEAISTTNIHYKK